MLAILAAVVIVLGCVLPWYRIGGELGSLTVIERNGFTGSGILAFLAAMATLALVTLPYAAGDQPIAADRGLVYLLILLVAIVGVAVWPLNVGEEFAGLLPDRAPGYWITIAGILILARATYDIFREPARR